MVTPRQVVVAYVTTHGGDDSVLGRLSGPGIEALLVRVVRTRTGDVVVGQGVVRRRLRAARLGPADLPEIVDALAAHLAALPGPVVAVSLDLLATRALHGATAALDTVLAVSHHEAAARAVALLQGGRSVADLVYPQDPPAFAPGAGDEYPEEVSVTVTEVPAGEAGRWLGVGPCTVAVETTQLRPLQRAAVRERASTVLTLPARAPHRLLVAPANYAGQGAAWARAVRDHLPGWDAANMTVPSPRAPMAFATDAMVMPEDWADPVTRIDLARQQVAPATHVLLEAMRPVLGTSSPGADCWSPTEGRRDVEALRADGKDVALLFHGSEVRRPDAHARALPWTPFGGPADETAAAFRRTTERVHAALADLDGPVFVSTLDLLDYVEDAHWLPVVLGPEDFRPAPPALTRQRPVVLHAPSSSTLKGSVWVDPALEKLHEAGLIEYRRLTHASPMTMAWQLRQADVVVDQVILGNPGVLAAQAMAAGRLVVAHLPGHVRRRFPEPPPVLEATPLDVADVVRDIALHPDDYRATAAAGPDFTRRLHDGRLSARILADVWLGHGIASSVEASEEGR